jgi:dihydrofolate synthase / folylpolyglutamate synthase
VDYRETIDWLFDQETRGIKFGLANVTGLLHHLGDPHHRFRSVHVAGTNGKGSVSAMAASVLHEAGYVTGLYTSPHLVDFRERVQVDGVCIPEQKMLRLAEEVRAYAESNREAGSRLTFFELTTAMAFAHFADAGVEEAVIEVGMGGRLDATNVIVPDCSVISRISLEHTEYLGDTIAAIAAEKAGIIKSGVPVVTIDQSDEALHSFRQAAAEKATSLKVVGRDVGFEALSSTLDGNDVYIEELGSEVHIPLLGAYQAQNCALSCGALTELMRRGVYISDEAIHNGLAKVRWPGRLEVVSRDPTLIFDVTHTPDGARVVAEEVHRLLGKNIVLVLGVLNDKDVEGIAAGFGRIAREAVATAPATKRAFPPATVAAALKKHCPVMEVSGVGAAIDQALTLASPNDAVLVTGSLFVIGEAMRWSDGKKTCE